MLENKNQYDIFFFEKKKVRFEIVFCLYFLPAEQTILFEHRTGRYPEWLLSSPDPHPPSNIAFISYFIAVQWNHISFLDNRIVVNLTSVFIYWMNPSFRKKTVSLAVPIKCFRIRINSANFLYSTVLLIDFKNKNSGIGEISFNALRVSLLTWRTKYNI